MLRNKHKISKLRNKHYMLTFCLFGQKCRYFVISDFLLNFGLSDCDLILRI